MVVILCWTVAENKKKKIVKNLTSNKNVGLCGACIVCVCMIIEIGLLSYLYSELLIPLAMEVIFRTSDRRRAKIIQFLEGAKMRFSSTQRNISLMSYD